jgi:hypothetical protein
MLLAMTQAK